jgi:hypothetical protein
MRPRDVRAITFCSVSIVLLFIVAFAASLNFLLALAATLAYAAFILTRPRMLRVYRRMRGEPDWSGYFDEGYGFTAEPEAPAPRRRQYGRR